MTYDCLLKREAWLGGGMGGGGHTMGGGGLRRGDAAPYIYIYVYTHLYLLVDCKYPAFLAMVIGGLELRTSKYLTA